MDAKTIAKIRQYYYGHKYSLIQLSKRFKVPELMIKNIINE